MHLPNAWVWVSQLMDALSFQVIDLYADIPEDCTIHFHTLPGSALFRPGFILNKKLVGSVLLQNTQVSKE